MGGGNKKTKEGVALPTTPHSLQRGRQSEGNPKYGATNFVCICFMFKLTSIYLSKKKRLKKRKSLNFSGNKKPKKLIHLIHIKF